MNAVKRTSLVLSALLIFLCFSDGVQAQSREDAITKFNEGFALFNEQGDFLAAIEKFKETIVIADEVGSEANDIRERAVGQIPRLAFMHAAQLVRERDLEGAVDAFQEAARLAESYGDDQIMRRARGNLPALHLNLGNQHFRNEQNEEALEQYRKAIELNPSYVSAYYQIALVYRRMGNVDRALENFDVSIDLAREAGDQENLERSQRAARDYLVFRASEQIEEEYYNRALDLLNRAAGYGESASMHYRFAEVYNNQRRYSDARASAERALELETGSRLDRARIYFELGLAHKGLENTQAACSAFRSAMVGDFRSPAEHEIEHELNCN
jgi:tetratricopeptide (TPR) repeat protein